MREHHLEVARTARYCTVGGDAEPDEVWFVLHGYGQLARRFLRRFEPVARSHRLIVAPEALSRFYIGSGEGRHGRDAVVGATWMTREDREVEIQDIVGYLDRLASAVVRGTPRVTVLGFSQGAAAAFRWVTYGGAPGLQRLIAWSGDVPHDLDMDEAAGKLRDVEVVVVAGADDATVPPEHAQAGVERLVATGIATRLVSHAGGHEIDPETLRSLADGG